MYWEEVGNKRGETRVTAVAWDLCRKWLFMSMTADGNKLKNTFSRSFSSNVYFAFQEELRSFKRKA